MFALSPTFRLEFLARTDFLLLFVLESSSSSISFRRNRAFWAKSADLVLPFLPPRVVVCDVLLIIIAGALQEEVSIIDINFFVWFVCELFHYKDRSIIFLDLCSNNGVCCENKHRESESAHKERKGQKREYPLGNPV